MDWKTEQFDTDLLCKNWGAIFVVKRLYKWKLRANFCTNDEDDPDLSHSKKEHLNM